MSESEKYLNGLIIRIRKDLQNSVTEKSKLSFPRFFREPIKFYGISSSDVGKISKKYREEVTRLNKVNFFKFSEKLFKSDYCEEAFLVSGWAPLFSKDFKKQDIKVFKTWIDKYINNWAKCDGFCNHTIGIFMERYPEFIKELKVWAKSNNIWTKRAAAVSLIIPAKNGKYLKDIFDIANLLLLDTNDMVQKGYGWLLKEASRKHEKEVFDYVLKRKAVMPRTALRYAIELMQPSLKKLAMEK